MKQLTLCLLTWFHVSIKRRHQSHEEARANQKCWECVFGRGRGSTGKGRDTSVRLYKEIKQNYLSILLHPAKAGTGSWPPSLHSRRALGPSVPSTGNSHCLSDTEGRASCSLLRTLHTFEEQPIHYRFGHFTNSKESLKQAPV